MEKFKNWLQQNGAEILSNTNQYEEIRFKGKEVGIKYKSGKFSNDFAKNAWYCFINNEKWDGKPLKTGRKNTYKKEKIALRERDGCNCILK